MPSSEMPKPSEDPAMDLLSKPADEAPAACSGSKANKKSKPRSRPKLPKPPARATLKKPSTKPKPKPAPLPATIVARGYEITVPNVKTCWAVHVLRACGHPVLDEALMSGLCHQPLVIYINRHMLRACTAKCKVESMEHFVASLCEVCVARLEPPRGAGVGVMNGITTVVHGMPLV